MPSTPSLPSDSSQAISSPPASALKSVEEAAAFVLAHTRHRPTVGLILGSGLISLADEIARPDVIGYQDMLSFPRPTVPGHSGDLIVGELEGRTIAALRGRPHFYEGYAMDQIGLTARLLRAIGCEILIATNAAGGLNPSFHAGDLMLIADHINLPGMIGFNPLMGDSSRAVEGWGDRFVSMAGAYDPRLATLALAAAKEANLALRSGVYAMVCGPSYETDAELRFLRAIGADAVGMSTAPEVVVARQLGMRALGISCITNTAISEASFADLGIANSPGGETSSGRSRNDGPHSVAPSPTADGHSQLTHAEVLEQGHATLPRLATLLRVFLRHLARENDR